MKNMILRGDIITNPPYKYCSEFILNALDSIPKGHKVAMFLKFQTLEEQKRYEEIYSKYPPKTIYIYSKRKNVLKMVNLKNIHHQPYAMHGLSGLRVNINVLN